MLAKVARCFTDHRNEDLIEHSVADLLKQRIFARARLRGPQRSRPTAHRSAAGAAGRQGGPTGPHRVDPRDRGKPLAGKSTLNRLELTPARADAKSRYKKIVRAAARRMDRWLVDCLPASQCASRRKKSSSTSTPPMIRSARRSGGRFFHGYYNSYCYLPLYIFCGEHLLCAQACGRRTSTPPRAASSELARIVAQIRATLAERANHRPRRQRLLPRTDHGLVRGTTTSTSSSALPKNKRLLASWAGTAARAGQIEFQDRQGRARVQGLQLSHPRRAGAARGASSAKPSIWPKGPTRGSSSPACPQNGSTHARCTKTLLCPRRDGEPHQGTAAVSVRRPHQHRNHAGQPTAAAASPPWPTCCCTRSASSAWKAPSWPRPVRHDPPQAAEDRRPAPRQRAPRLVLARRELSVSGDLPASLRQPPPLAAAGPRVSELRPLHFNPISINRGRRLRRITKTPSIELAQLRSARPPRTKLGSPRSPANRQTKTPPAR